MSTGTEVNKTNNQLHTDYDVSKIFVWNNRYQKETLKNITGGALDYLPGTLMGRITTGGDTGKIIPLASAAVDGSAVPVGILLTNVEGLAAAGEKEVSICIAGDVVESKLILDGSDTVDTVIDGRTIRDRISADTHGIKLVASAELTDFDNQ